MEFSKLIFLAFLAFQLFLVNGSILNNIPKTWTHKLDLGDSHGVKFRWRNTKPDENEEGQRWIIMEASAKARGYIGVGFSPHGGMAGSDIAIAWIDSDGESHLKDYHGIENGQPIEDTKQDYELLSLEKNVDWLTVIFKRRWDTCDPEDFLITQETMRLIWAYSNSKPMMRSNGEFIPSYHGPATRGARSIIVAEGVFPPSPDEAPEMYPGAKSYDFTQDNVPITLKDTYYHCDLFKFDVDLTKKKHMIGWKPIIQKGNEDIIHHMILFECSVPPEDVPLFDAHHKSHKGGSCYTPNMPAEWGRNCVSFALAWVVGSEGEMLPSHAGAPLGENHGGATYFMLEMHYENAKHRITTDSSGVRLFYTEELREYDGGTLLVGYRHSPFLLIPPHQDNFMIHGVCGTECTSRVIPEGGIHLTNTMVHLHLTGRKIRLRHFRNGIEQPLIAEDNHYDFNYQQSKVLKDELTILPGDELVTECEYTTNDVDRYVVGGLATNQEMCEVFFFYYPRVNLSQCTSQYEFHDFFKGVGVDGTEGDVLEVLHMPYEPHLLPPEDQEKDLGDDAKELEAIEEGLSWKSVFNHINITKPQRNRGKSVGAWLEEIKWSNEKGKELEERWKEGKHYQFCSKPGLKRVVLKNHIIDYPEIKESLKKGPSQVCLRENYVLRSGGCPVSSSFLLTILISFLAFLRNY